jgi:hypothetical protein
MKFDMSAAWSEAMRLIAGNRDVVLIVAGVFFFLPYVGFTMLMGDRMAGLQASAESGNTDPETAMAAMMSIYGSVWWVILLLTLLQGIGMLGLLALLKDRSRPTVGEALTIGVKSLLPYLAAQILAGLLMMILLVIPFVIGQAGSVGIAVLVGLIAFVAVIYLFTKFSLVPPVVVVDRVFNPLTALGRSWRLTKGNSFRLWLFYFLLIVAVIVVGMVLSIVVGLVFALAGPETALIGNALVAGLLNAAWATLFLAALAAAHRQLAGGTPEAVGETFE